MLCPTIRKVYFRPVVGSVATADHRGIVATLATCEAIYASLMFSSMGIAYRGELVSRGSLSCASAIGNMIPRATREQNKRGIKHLQSLVSRLGPRAGPNRTDSGIRVDGCGWTATTIRRKTRLSRTVFSDFPDCYENFGG